MRLIDAERLKAVLEKNFGHTGGASVLEQLIDEQPTIQPVATDTNVGDKISRQVEIDRFNVIRPVDPKKDEYTKGIDVGIAMCIVAVKDQPSAQPEPQWIPVSEGVPKKDGRYQVTRHDYVTNTEFIDILWYEKNTWWDRQATGDYAVTAWMPLPEAYKEGGEKI